MWEVAEAVFTTPPEERNTNKMESILVWFRQRSPIFENLEDGMYSGIEHMRQTCSTIKDLTSIIQRHRTEIKLLYTYFK